MFSRLSFLLKRRVNKLPVWAWILTGIASLAAVILAFSGNASPTQTSNVPGSSTLDSLGFAFDVFVKLCLVLGLIYISLNFLRRWQGGLRNKPAHRLAILESVHISQRQSIHLVRVGEREFLVGGTDQNIVLLSEVDPLAQEAEQEISQETGLHLQEKSNLSFSSLFDHNLSK